MGNAVTTPADDEGRWAKTFAGTPEQIRTARRWVDGLLDGCPVAADVLLVLAELANNAVAHSASRGSAFIVGLDLRSGCARVSVTDRGGPGEPRIATPDPDRLGGRGLLLVEHVTGGRWGFDSDASGRRVWAELAWKPGATGERALMRGG